MSVVAVPDMTAGQVILMHGGEFRIISDAQPANHPSKGVFVAYGECLSGEVPGYFKPGSTWTFQGNELARFHVAENS